MAIELQQQILSCSINLIFDDARLSDTLEYLLCSAAQEVPVRKELTYRVEGLAPYTIYEEGDLVGEWPSVEDVLYILYLRIYLRMTERMLLSGWVSFHGGLVEINGRRIALLGDKGAGKSTLCTALVAEGYRVESDEMFLARRGQALAMPRRFHLKPGTDEQLPVLRDKWAHLPAQRSGASVIRALDPGSLGHAWKIRPGRLDEVIWIEPVHDGRASTLQPGGSFSAVQWLLQSARQWSGGRDRAMTEAAQLAQGGGHQLNLCSVVSGVEQLQILAATSA